MVKLPALRAIRERILLTQAELAQRADITQANLSKIERGGDARISTARRLARALKVAPADLMTEESGR